MGFMNVGIGELLVVLLIAILVAGPKRAVEIARTLGRLSRQLGDLSREFTSALQAEIDADDTAEGNAGKSLDRVVDELDNILSGRRTGAGQIEAGSAVKDPDQVGEELESPLSDTLHGAPADAEPEREDSAARSSRVEARRDRQ